MKTARLYDAAFGPGQRVVHNERAWIDFPDD
jgi:hypothetical protein